VTIPQETASDGSHKQGPRRRQTMFAGNWKMT
jgi:hypothetical protein